MIITLGILLFATGLLLGLYVGERGRRRDVMWWAALDPAPKDLGSPAEVIPPGDPEGEALERAEILDVVAGLKESLRAEGRTASDEEIEEEALRLVNQIHAEVGG